MTLLGNPAQFRPSAVEIELIDRVTEIFDKARLHRSGQQRRNFLNGVVGIAVVFG